MKHSLSLLALTLAAAAGSAQASTVTFTGFANGSEGVTYKLDYAGTSNDVQGSANAGGFATTLDGSPSFETYCVDLYQAISFGVAYSDYGNFGASHVFNNASAYGDLSRLYARAGAVTTATQEAAFQLAVWEIAYETGGSYNLGSGTASFTGSAGAISLASTWLSSLGAGGPAIQVIESREHQDVIRAVPEPETYAMFLAGLAAMGFVARRRKA